MRSRSRSRSRYLLAFAIGLVGCPANPNPNPPPTGDADATPRPYDGTAAEVSTAARRACANIRRFPVECAKEGGGRCEELLDVLVADKLVSPPVDLECIAAAGDVAALRKCPAIFCAP